LTSVSIIYAIPALIHDLDSWHAEPIVDMTREIPYEVLNSIVVSSFALDCRSLMYQLPYPQNPFQPHGLATYIKGTFQTKPRLEVYKSVFEKVANVNAERPKMQCGVGFEYFPLQKVSSVPKDATAFSRSPYPSILIMLRWPDDQADDLEFARSSVHDLMGIISEGNVDLPKPERGASGYAYANYGESHIRLFSNQACSPPNPRADPTGEKPQFGKEGEVFNDVTPSVFGTNYHRLQQVKKKYDPEILFSKWFVVTPA
jgi:hypothetical protein